MVDKNGPAVTTIRDHSMSSAQDILEPTDILSPLDVLIADTAKALAEYSAALMAAEQSVAPFGARFLDHAYRLWLAYQAEPKRLEQDLVNAGIKLTAHQKSPFSPVVKILYQRSGITADKRRFVSRHARMLDAVHKIVEEERPTPLEPGEATGPAMVEKGFVLQLIQDQGGIKEIERLANAKKVFAPDDMDMMIAFEEWLDTGMQALGREGLFHAVVDVQGGRIQRVRLLDAVGSLEKEIWPAVRRWQKEQKDPEQTKSISALSGFEEEITAEELDPAILRLPPRTV